MKKLKVYTQNGAYRVDKTEIYQKVKAKEIIEYRGAFYDKNYMPSFGKLLTHRGLKEVERCGMTRNVHHIGSTDEYYRGYHNNSARSIVPPSYEGFTVGVEFEKTDPSVCFGYNLDALYSENNNWRKERDGSLDYSPKQGGFELISPTMPFDFTIIEKQFTTPVILAHINADYDSKWCGGHINIGYKSNQTSEFLYDILDNADIVPKKQEKKETKNYTPKDLFDMVSGYLPLIYAMYPKRINERYCLAMNKDELKKKTDHYCAIFIKNTHIELRIFPAIKNLGNIMWRLKLCDLLLKYPADNAIAAYKNFTTLPEFKSLFDERYTKEKYDKLIRRFFAYTKKYENIEPSQINKFSKEKPLPAESLAQPVECV